MISLAIDRSHKEENHKGIFSHSTWFIDGEQLDDMIVVEREGF